MAQTVLIRLTPGTLPLTCYPDNQMLNNDIIGQATAELLTQPEGLLYNYGDTVPLADHRIWPWYRTVGGYPDDWYQYVNAAGFWLSLYKNSPPGPSALRDIYVGTEISLVTYDGGDISAIGSYTGAFWEVDHAMDGLIPMGAGIINGAVPAKTLNPQETYGEAAHMQLTDEVAPHTHTPDPKNMETAPGSGTSNGIGYFPAATGDPHADLAILPQTYLAGQLKMSIIPPVYGVYFIKRTIRAYRRVAP